MVVRGDLMLNRIINNIRCKLEIMKVDVFDVDPTIAGTKFENSYFSTTETSRTEFSKYKEELKRWIINQPEDRRSIISLRKRKGDDLRDILPEDDIYWRRIEAIKAKYRA